MVADIGLVGYPNAGKSTLINAITGARAKIGDYPFTTLQPVLGTIPLEPLEEAELIRVEEQAGRRSSKRPRIIIADIPGIIEGAHEGVGLGLEFLRHIERTSVLAFMIDVSVEREHEPVATYRNLVKELGTYQEELLKRPRLVILNKIDDPLDVSELTEIEEEMKEAMKNETPRPHPGTLFPISALQQINLSPLRKELVDLMIQARSGVSIRGEAD